MVKDNPNMGFPTSPDELAQEHGEAFAQGYRMGFQKGLKVIPECDCDD